MRAQEFWAAKIVQLLHDPPGKPYFLRPHSGGHKKLARKILERDRHMGPTPHDVLRHKKFARKILERVFPDSPAPMKTAPDLLATGADRPLLTLPFAEGYGLGNQYFHRDPLVTHPLCRSHLRLPIPGTCLKSPVRILMILKYYSSMRPGSCSIRKKSRLPARMN